MDSNRISQIVEKYGLEKFRVKLLKDAVFEKNVSSYDQLSTLKKDLREVLIEKELGKRINNHSINHQ